MPPTVDAHAISREQPLSVVIPVYNEEQTLEEILRQVRAVGLHKEIILVDDCSTDGTHAILKKLADEPDIRVFYHEQNRGKGAALRTGIEHATADLVIIQDADLEYDPGDYPRLLKPFYENNADVVFGSRFVGGASHRVLYYWHYLGNKFLTTLSNAFTDLNLTDMETCYKVFKREVIQSVRQGREWVSDVAFVQVREGTSRFDWGDRCAFHACAGGLARSQVT
ncbi:MAG: glycosyltransferase [Planctomycetes bacterium]|jgi:glycosyltransferase involved in cell wall biosynthesis|nr:glycosyltransferase [Planctomycetota bacterium]